MEKRSENISHDAQCKAGSVVSRGNAFLRLQEVKQHTTKNSGKTNSRWESNSFPKLSSCFPSMGDEIQKKSEETNTNILQAFRNHYKSVVLHYSHTCLCRTKNQKIASNKRQNANERLWTDYERRRSDKRNMHNAACIQWLMTYDDQVFPFDLDSSCVRRLAFYAIVNIFDVLFWLLLLSQYVLHPPFIPFRSHSISPVFFLFLSRRRRR